MNYISLRRDGAFQKKLYTLTLLVPLTPDQRERIEVSVFLSLHYFKSSSSLITELPSSTQSLQY